MSEPVVTSIENQGLPVIWPPLLGIVWAVLPFATSFALGSSDLGVTLLYLWCWAIVIPTTVLGVGALVVRYRYGAMGSAGRWRRGLWYWIGGLYAAAGIPVLAWLL